MKKVEISAYGAPEEVARCVEAPDVGVPGPGEITFDVLAFPINPADLSMCRGNYRLRPPLPATPGAECVGRVTAVGAGVAGLQPGDLVINLERENWATQRRIAAADAIPIPAGLDLKQAAMLRINPPTAQLLLEDLSRCKGAIGSCRTSPIRRSGGTSSFLPRSAAGTPSMSSAATMSQPNSRRSAPMR